MNAKSIIMVLVLMLTMSTKLFAQAGNETEEITLTEIDKDINPNGPRNRAPGMQIIHAYIHNNDIIICFDNQIIGVNVFIIDSMGNSCYYDVLSHPTSTHIISGNFAPGIYLLRIEAENFILEGYFIFSPTI